MGDAGWVVPRLPGQGVMPGRPQPWTKLAEAAGGHPGGPCDWGQGGSSICEEGVLPVVGEWWV